MKYYLGIADKPRNTSWNPRRQQAPSWEGLVKNRQSNFDPSTLLAILRLSRILTAGIFINSFCPNGPCYCLRGPFASSLYILYHQRIGQKPNIHPWIPKPLEGAGWFENCHPCFEEIRWNKLRYPPGNDHTLGKGKSSSKGPGAWGICQLCQRFRISSPQLVLAGWIEPATVTTVLLESYSPENSHATWRTTLWKGKTHHFSQTSI